MRLDFLEPLLSAEDAMKADRYTIDSLGISGSELMERAGLAVAQKVEALLKTHLLQSPVPVVVVCGPGNNGGDGWVAARRLWQNGIRVFVLTLVQPETLKGEAKVAAKQFLSASSNDFWKLPNLDAPFLSITSIRQFDDVFARYQPSVVVDAIFGTGLRRSAEGLFAEVISHLNTHRTQSKPGPHVLAVDIPSGLQSDGKIWSGPHVFADSTLAIQFRKIAHVTGAFLESCGEVSCADIGIKLPNPPTARTLLAGNQPTLSLLRAGSRNDYKGRFGHVGVLFGSNGIQGASALCAYSALRAGAGLVTLLIPSTAKIDTLIIPEIMRHVLSSPIDVDVFSRFTAFAIGTGVNASRYETANEILTYAMQKGAPAIIDAGALPLLRVIPRDILPTTQIVATPHPGEAGRLLNKNATEIEEDRIKSATALLEYSRDIACDLTWVLKGASPILAHKTHGLVVCEGGITALGVGGSGDVLAGICSALLAQTESSFAATLLAVSTHLEAGRRLMRLKSRGFLAHEIADAASFVLFGHPLDGPRI